MENMEIKLNLTKDEFNILWAIAMQNVDYWTDEIKENGEGNYNKELYDLATAVFNKIQEFNPDKPEKEVE